MSNDCCERCEGRLVEIDHWGERLRGCPQCNRWQAATGEVCRLAADDIAALKALKDAIGEPRDRAMLASSARRWLEVGGEGKRR